MSPPSSSSTTTTPAVAAEIKAAKADPDLDFDFDEKELEKILNQEASQVTREAEVYRVLGAFKLNPYEILDLNLLPGAGVTDSDIQRTYRKKSLLIHPDKLKHPRGIEAFDLLKKAQAELSDPAKKKPLDEIIQDARMLVLRGMGLPRETPDEHEKLRAGSKDMGGESLREKVRKKTKELLIEEELRRRRVNKMTMIAEGAEAKRQEDAVTERKRKAEEKERWEETREDRVTDWRKFQGGKKKKAKKSNVLG
ncbi:hypothetical protein JCM11251_000939 [Rhodosporidiobolus azoricus]